MNKILNTAIDLDKVTLDAKKQFNNVEEAKSYLRYAELK